MNHSAKTAMSSASASSSSSKQDPNKSGNKMRIRAFPVIKSFNLNTKISFDELYWKTDFLLKDFF